MVEWQVQEEGLAVHDTVRYEIDSTIHEPLSQSRQICRLLYDFGTTAREQQIHKPLVSSQYTLCSRETFNKLHSSKIFNSIYPIVTIFY